MEQKTDDRGSYVEFSHFGDTNEQIIAELIERQKRQKRQEAEYAQARDRHDG